MNRGQTEDLLPGSGQQLAGQRVVSQTLYSLDESRTAMEPPANLLVRLPAFPQSQNPSFHRTRRAANCRPRAGDTDPADDPINVFRAAPDAVGDILQSEAFITHFEDPPLDRSEMVIHAPSPPSLHFTLLAERGLRRRLSNRGEPYALCPGPLTGSSANAADRLCPWTDRSE